MGKPYTKEHWKYLLRVLPKKCCSICGVTKEESSTRRLVWDHDHSTNIIRGVLCDLCNNWIEYYRFIKEHSFLDAKAVYGPGVASWMMAYKEKIEIHLKCNTGIIYSDKKPKCP